MHGQDHAEVGHLGFVREFDCNAIDAPDEIKKFFGEINACVGRLQSAKVRAIDPSGEHPMPKVVWKMLAMRQSIIYRSVELHNALAILVNADNLLGALIIARPLIELMAFAGDLNEKLTKGIAAGDLAQMDNAIQASNFSTRWEEMPEETKATNIMTLLVRFDRDFMGDKSEKSVTSMHAYRNSASGIETERDYLLTSRVVAYRYL